MISPIFIIGAPRSGTNILRDVLTSYPGFITWPCDEINYIWKHHNLAVAHDQLSSRHASPKVKKYIINKFLQRYLSAPLNVYSDSIPKLVEKTCANSLRLPFINSIFPNCKYIFITRDPLDAIPSALKRWKASLEPFYLYKKAKYVPITDLPYYSIKYLNNRIYKLFISKNASLSCWGPKYKNFSKDIKSLSQIEVVTRQWFYCNSLSTKFFSDRPSIPCLKLDYNNFVNSPEESLHDILNFLLIKPNQEYISKATSSVVNTFISKGRLSSDMTLLKINNELESLGYEK